MMKRLLMLGACLLASTGVAAAAPCGPVTVTVPSGVEFNYAPCAPFTDGLGAIRCSNCSVLDVYAPLHGPAMCVRPIQHYAILTLRRHLVNGKCVPEEAMLGRERDVAQHLPAAAPAPAPPPRSAPARIAPPRALPMPLAAPRIAPQAPAAPRMAAPAPARPVVPGRSVPESRQK